MTVRIKGDEGPKEKVWELWLEEGYGGINVKCNVDGAGMSWWLVKFVESDGVLCMESHNGLPSENFDADDDGQFILGNTY